MSTQKLSGWEYRERPVAVVTLKHPETGETIGPIHIPYEGEPPSEEAAYAQAWELYQRTAHIRGNLSDEEIEETAASLRDGPFGEWFTGVIREQMQEGITVSVKAGPSDDPEALAKEEAVAAEMSAIIREKGGAFVDTFLENSPFWHDFTRDALTHAWAWALDDLLSEHPDALEWPNTQFHPTLTKRFREGDYLYGAVMNLAEGWGQLLWEVIVSELKPNDDNGQATPKIKEAIERIARERVLKRTPPEPPAMRPIFDPTGYGYSPSDGISAGAKRALLGPGGAWKPRKDDGFPEFTHSWGENNIAWYSPDSGIFPTPEDALRAVECLSDGHVDAFEYITSKWLANRDRETRGPFDGVYIGADEFLDDRGISRHKLGAHKPENVTEVAQQVHELSRFMVSGSVDDPSKRGKHPPLRIDAPLVVISQYVRRPRLDGTEETIGWYIRPGDWAATMQDLSPQFAVTTRALFQLHSRRDYMAKRIGRYLLSQFRYRASKGTYTQPLYIETILEGARIDIGPSERKNPGRLRERVENSLHKLKKLHPPVLKDWEYLDTVPETGRGMLERWLRARIVCTPADGLTVRYAELTARGNAKRNRALAQRGKRA